METTLFQKKYKLHCGHVFHTDCIMSWFRTKKNTCPYCRCTGEKPEHIPVSISSRFESNTLIRDDWESNEEVQAYLENDNPTKNQIINAYYIRDMNMNIDIESVFNSCVRCLRINPSDFEKQIQQKFKQENEIKFKEITKRTIENPTEKIELNYSCKFSEYLKNNIESQHYLAKLNAYHTMEEMKNDNNHKGIYSLIEITDLHSMGW